MSIFIHMMSIILYVVHMIIVKLCDWICSNLIQHPNFPGNIEIRNVFNNFKLKFAVLPKPY